MLAQVNTHIFCYPLLAQKHRIVHNRIIPKKEGCYYEYIKND